MLKSSIGKTIKARDFHIFKFIIEKIYFVPFEILEKDFVQNLVNYWNLDQSNCLLYFLLAVHLLFISLLGAGRKLRCRNVQGNTDLRLFSNTNSIITIKAMNTK